MQCERMTIFCPDQVETEQNMLLHPLAKHCLHCIQIYHVPYHHSGVSSTNYSRYYFWGVVFCINSLKVMVLYVSNDHTAIIAHIF